MNQNEAFKDLENWCAKLQQSRFNEDLRMNSYSDEYEYWDDLSVAAAEIRDAMEQDFSKGAISALTQRLYEIIRQKGSFMPEAERAAQADIFNKNISKVLEEARRKHMEELTPEQEDYLEEEAREKYFEQKQKDKARGDMMECKFCGFEYPASKRECPACEEQLKAEG